MSNVIRSFDQLSDAEQDIAVEKVFRSLSDDYESGRISLIDSPVSEDELQNRLWDWAGAIARDASFIPDDGSMVVRL